MFLFSLTLNWLTASQSFAAGFSKSTTRACAPRIEPSCDGIFDCDAVYEQAVEGAVAGFQRGACRVGELAECVVEGRVGQLGD